MGEILTMEEIRGKKEKKRGYYAVEVLMGMKEICKLQERNSKK